MTAVDGATLQFLGAAGTVTGSKYLVRAGRRQILLDGGLFQGLKDLRLRNWGKPAFDPVRIDAVVLSHAHIDHSGYLPVLAKAGFRGKIFCTSGTADLVKILLPDAATLQEEEAENANRHGYSKHHPALPLFTLEDARAALKQLRPCPYGQSIQVTDNVTCLFRRAGHILGSASEELSIGATTGSVRLVFSGDLGRWNQPILRDPEFVPEADVLLVESTYGDRVHPPDSEEALARIVQEAVNRGGVLLIPAFAIGRTQLLIWMLHHLEEQGKIPSVPIYLDSPMAMDATEIYCRHTEDHDLEMDEQHSPIRLGREQIAKTPEESKALNRVGGPAIIISGSGMATGGRILHHLKLRLPDSRTTVLLVGYQAAGTRGRLLQEGAKALRMYGEQVPVRAKVETLSGMSAHADRDEILRWLSGFKKAPRQVYIVHGEPEPAQHLAESIRSRFGWNVRAAVDGETVQLSS